MTNVSSGASWHRISRVLFVAVLGALTLPAGPALAIQGFGISPTSQEITLAPGGSTHGTLTVINDGDTNITYDIYATDYRVKGETYQGVFTNEGSGPDLSAVSWFTVPKGNQTIAARQEATFPYTLTAPKGAAVGGHYAAVFIQTVPPPQTGGTILNKIDRIGSLFYITISGALVQKGNLLPLSVAWLQSNSPVGAGVRLSNSGNVHFLTQGTAQLYNPFGKVGGVVAFRGEVLPSTTRRFAIALPASSAIGLYKVQVKVNYLGRNATQSQWMLLVPKMTFVIVSATLLLVLILGLWALMRRARRRSK